MSAFSCHPLSGLVMDHEFGNINFSQFYSSVHEQNQASKFVVSDEHNMKKHSTDQSSTVVDRNYPGSDDQLTQISEKRNGSPLNSAQSKEQNGKKQRRCNNVNEKKDETEQTRKSKKVAPVNIPIDYVHVRARRGQATDSHSLAERVRREKISERMKILQRLVPGCDKVTGKALVLDEIINYVQSLQNQVEFLSMKLASFNPVLYEFGMDLDAYTGEPDHERIMTSMGSQLMAQCSSKQQSAAFVDTCLPSTFHLF